MGKNEYTKRDVLKLFQELNDNHEIHDQVFMILRKHNIPYSKNKISYTKNAYVLLVRYESLLKSEHQEAIREIQNLVDYHEKNREFQKRLDEEYEEIINNPTQDESGDGNGEEQESGERWDLEVPSDDGDEQPSTSQRVNSYLNSLPFEESKVKKRNTSNELQTLKKRYALNNKEPNPLTSTSRVISREEFE